MEERNKAINKKMLGYFIISVAIGMAIAVWFFVTQMDDRDLGTTLFTPVMGLVFGSFIYGFINVHPFRRFPTLLVMPVVGWCILLVIVLAWAMYGGLLYYMPKAIIRLIMKKPILSDKEINKLLKKGLIDEE